MPNSVDTVLRFDLPGLTPGVSVAVTLVLDS